MTEKHYPAGALYYIGKWVLGHWFNFLRWYQQFKPAKECAYPTCQRQWHDHMLDIRMCRHHHPSHDAIWV